MGDRLGQSQYQLHHKPFWEWVQEGRGCIQEVCRVHTTGLGAHPVHSTCPALQCAHWPVLEVQCEQLKRWDVPRPISAGIWQATAQRIQSSSSGNMKALVSALYSLVTHWHNSQWTLLNPCLCTIQCLFTFHTNICGDYQQSLVAVWI